jgi:hypothetical protein
LGLPSYRIIGVIVNKDEDPNANNVNENNFGNNNFGNSNLLPFSNNLDDRLVLTESGDDADGDAAGGGAGGNAVERDGFEGGITGLGNGELGLLGMGASGNLE